MDGQNRERGKRDQPVRVRLRRDEVIDQLLHLTITNEAKKQNKTRIFFNHLKTHTEWGHILPLSAK